MVYQSIPTKNQLKLLYLSKKHSSKEISKILGFSCKKIDYWLKVYKIQKRSISEAIYLKHNPDGDPFVLRKFKFEQKSFLYGLGLGLYWGEGNKANKNSIRLGNSNPKLIKGFMDFLEGIYGVKKEDLRFWLQIFGDIDKNIALEFWANELSVPKSQFMTPVVSKLRGNGTYRNKSQHGVLTVCFHTTKLRNIICGAIDKL